VARKAASTSQSIERSISSVPYGGRKNQLSPKNAAAASVSPSGRPPRALASWTTT